VVFGESLSRNHKPKNPFPKICLTPSLTEMADFEYNDEKNTVAGARSLQSKFTVADREL
jgi:hypothetical protein